MPNELALRSASRRKPVRAGHVVAYAMMIGYALGGVPAPAVAGLHLAQDPGRADLQPLGPAEKADAATLTVRPGARRPSTAPWLNSLFVAVVTVLVTTAATATVSFVLARIEFRWNRLIYFFIIAGMMIPIHSAVIPLYILQMKLHMQNNLVALSLIYAAFRIPISVFILESFMLTIPRELEECAFMDGAGLGTVFSRIIMPLSRHGLIVIIVLTVLACWNELLVAMLSLEQAAVQDPADRAAAVRLGVLQRLHRDVRGDRHRLHPEHHLLQPDAGPHRRGPHHRLSQGVGARHDHQEERSGRRWPSSSCPGIALYSLLVVVPVVAVAGAQHLPMGDAQQEGLCRVWTTTSGYPRTSCSGTPCGSL